MTTNIVRAPPLADETIALGDDRLVRQVGKSDTSTNSSRDRPLFWGTISLSTATLLFSGVPAALYERLVDRDSENTISMWIWLAGAAFLSFPAVQRLL